MSPSVAERLAAILPPDCQGEWTRAADGAVFPLAAPREREGFVAVMELAAADGLVVQPIGFGSKVAWCRPAPRLDLVLSTRNFAGVVEYAAADGTLTARAGTPMAELAAVAAAGGHHLSPDVPRPAGATLGGVLAAGASGVDRLRYGAVRDQVLGLSVLLADGRLAKGGGRLVKNATGYDLARLLCGSHGTLAVLLEASLRLWPRPAARRLARVRVADRAAALELARRLHARPVQLVTLLAHDLDRERPEGPWTLLAALGGRADVVAWEAERIAEVAPEVEIDASDEALAAARDLELGRGGGPDLSLASLPGDLPANLAALELHAGECGLAARTLAHPALARVLVWLGAGEPAGAPAPDRLLALHERLGGLRGRMRWLAPPPGLLAHVDPAGPIGPGLALMRRLRRALDPAGRLAGGRLHAEL
ncbi:MAG: FAD-binding oxidoreductase [Planctomycetota bacterium]